MYDVTNQNSFNNLELWLHELHQNCSGISIIIGRSDYCGNHALW